jgi:membrane glycosyltransferase
MDNLTGAIEPAADLAPSATLASLQSGGGLRLRRIVVLAVNAATCLALAGWMASVVGAGGWTSVDVLLFGCFLVMAPWTVLGFWNALIGLWLLHGRRNGLEQAAPFGASEDDEPLRLKTALVMTLRNEDPTRALLRLKTMKRSIDATGHGTAFGYFILSDTSNPDVTADEEAAVEAWRRAAADPERIVYRRRRTNAGFKAGNLHDFCKRWGQDYDLMLPLDADSLMTGRTIVRLARMMQARPRIGILQSLVVGAPTSSAFARLFQFGMRHGMRAYTLGCAWWAGDCGPYWGHNALVRIVPFMDHCRLPVLSGGPPLGGPVLSHDQIEAALMRKAGYEVRVLPEETGSWEDAPPDLFQFSARDLRWCQGNMQYWKLLGLPGLRVMSRFQLAWAILMFLGAPATTAMIALAPIKVLAGQDASFPAGLAIGLYLTVLAMHLSPKLAGLADIVLTRGGVARYGGATRFLASAVIEIVFSFLLGAVTTFRTTVFMIGLFFGRSVVWNGQARDAHGIAWSSALRELWPPFLFGAAVCGALIHLSPATFAWSLPLTLGYLLAVPFAVLTASPAFGRLLERQGLGAIPEEIDPEPELQAVRGR